MSLIPVNLPSQQYSPGGTVNVSLGGLPTTLFGRLCHLSKLTFHASFTPTFNSGTGSIVGNNNFVKTLDIYTGRYSACNGPGFNLLRMKERLHTGRSRIPEADIDTASGTARYIDRVYHFGPPNFISPDDFAVPVGDLTNGEIRIQFGAHADLGDVTAVANGTLRIVAWLALKNEIVVPPAYQTQLYSAPAAFYQMPGRALYDIVALLNDTSFGAIASGDFNAVGLDLGGGAIVGNVKSYDLMAGYLDEMAAGQLALGSEAEAASDDPAKMLVSGSVSAATAEVVPVLWSGRNAKITKLPLAESNATLRWDGSQNTAGVFVTRILETPPSVIADIGKRSVVAVGKREIPGSIRPKTESKKPWAGTNRLENFMPWQIKVTG